MDINNSSYRVLEIVLASISSLNLLVNNSTNLSGSKLSLSRENDDSSIHMVATDIEQEDVIDGFPIAAEATFWKWILIRKAALACLQIIILAANSYYLVAQCDEGILSPTLSFFSSMIFLSIILLSVVQDQRRHRPGVLHLSALFTVKSFSLIYEGLDPRRLHGTSGVSGANLGKVDLAAALISWAISVSTPRGPAVHLPESKVYDKKTLGSCKPFPEANVSGEDRASFLGILLFSYSTQVFLLGRSITKITLDKLPLLPARLRARFNFAELMHAMEFKAPFSRKGLRLLYHLIKANLVYFLALQILCIITTFGHYAPIYFIQEFLAYLDCNPRNKNRALGWFYVGGILFAYTLLIISSARLNAVSSQTLRTKLGLQLKTLLYAKTLLRKDIASTATVLEENNQNQTVKFSTKAEVMNLMTTDVRRVKSLFGIGIGGYMLYNLLGASALVGLGIGIALMPLNQVVIKIVVRLQGNVMKARDERASLTTELLGAIRMIKLMAWERGFEKRVLSVRERELELQKRIFWYQNLWNTLSNSIPLFFALGSFWHFSVIRRQELTPPISFMAIVIFGQIKFPLNLLPEFLAEILQAFVSAQRIEKYLDLPEVSLSSLETTDEFEDVALHSATISWNKLPIQDQEAIFGSNSTRTPKVSFALVDITTKLPRGQISLLCGKIGSGKTLLLLGLLGETDLLAGRVSCPRVNYKSFENGNNTDSWLVQGMCAYAPQTAWLRNQTLKENILFYAPFDAKRYSAVLEACALNPDIAVFEDGDQSELGEQSVVSLARALYSRASILLLDDVLSAVDAHTAHHMWKKAFKGELTRGRTVILISHHVQIVGLDAKHIVALEGGRLKFSGSWTDFKESFVSDSVMAFEEIGESAPDVGSREEVAKKNLCGIIAPDLANRGQKEKNEEVRLDGHISQDVWLLYVRAAGQLPFQFLLATALFLASLSPIAENGWLKIWSSDETSVKNAHYYVGIYAAIVLLHFLRTVLFANLHFHDTTSRGRLLNRFGKDFYGIDTVLPNELGMLLMIILALAITTLSLTYVNGWSIGLAIIFTFFTAFISMWIYGQVARDLRRLASITASPLFGLYSETLSGLSVIRAWGLSSKFFKTMIMAVDTNTNPEYWTMGLNRWLSVRFQLATAVITSVIAAFILITPSIDASWAGVAFAFSTTLPLDMYWCPHLPDVLHGISLEIQPGEKVGVVGRTGSGKSTLALALLRFVEATEDSIWIDGLNTKMIGLSDLRRDVTIVPPFQPARESEFVDSTFANLDAHVSELGSNFSTGERQSLCLARAFLRKAKILIMDEATASVDYATDQVISKTVRQKLRGCALITIAHRLRTVIDYDRIIVMDEGQIVEKGSPYDLIYNTDSHFHGLCKASGAQEFASLKALLTAGRRQSLYD
ncbi:hypothetical protein CPB83DRAFT_897342 [Crepidotus variabilis]|uniref:P-loop containing nucleoside triphosphate hydrolase protein n=1 Tax=Crepidotus variabilis TaxID=179855 RepID=A0A9P6JLW3_9AGAR|nr:hypothetical protein CPB83DRAFT_897342 [Crepidotus variabilis]